MFLYNMIENREYNNDYNIISLTNQIKNLGSSIIIQGLKKFQNLLVVGNFQYNFQ